MDSQILLSIAKPIHYIRNVFITDVYAKDIIKKQSTNSCITLVIFDDLCGMNTLHMSNIYIHYMYYI